MDCKRRYIDFDDDDKAALLKYIHVQQLSISSRSVYVWSN